MRESILEGSHLYIVRLTHNKATRATYSPFRPFAPRSSASPRTLFKQLVTFAPTAVIKIIQICIPAVAAVVFHTALYSVSVCNVRCLHVVVDHRNTIFPVGLVANDRRPSVILYYRHIRQKPYLVNLCAMYTIFIHVLLRTYRSLYSRTCANTDPSPIEVFLNEK